MNRTGIEWVVNPDGSRGFTWNPIVGCTKGCEWCYARRFAKRSKCNLCQTFTPHLHPERLGQPLKRKKPSSIFVCSMGELFDPLVKAQWIDEVFTVMALSPQHSFLLLTKRPERMKEILSDGRFWGRVSARRLIAVQTARRSAKEVRLVTVPAMPWPLPNVTLGASVTNQADADERIPILLQTPAARRFISVEPMLADIRPSLFNPHGGIRGIHELDWVIVGALTGPGSRDRQPKPEWVQSVIDQCGAAEVPVFVKDNVRWPRKIQEFPR